MFAIEVVETLEDHKPRDKKTMNETTDAVKEGHFRWQRETATHYPAVTSEVANHQTVP